MSCGTQSSRRMGKPIEMMPMQRGRGMLHLSITGSQRRGRAQSPCQEEAEEAEEEDCGLWSEQPENRRAWATEEMQRISQASSRKHRQFAVMRLLLPHLGLAV